MGPCNENNRGDYTAGMGRGLGRGAGRGRGRGRGMGFRWGNAFGFRQGRFQAGESDRTLLENEVQFLKSQLSQAEKELEQFRNEKKGD
jgi:hypothetical protein